MYLETDLKGNFHSANKKQSELILQNAMGH